MFRESSMRHGDEPVVVTVFGQSSEFPKWKQQTLVYDDGKVFMPAAVFFASDERGAMMAFFDAASVVLYGGHVYVDSEWLCEHCETSQHAEQIKKAASKCRSCAAGRC